MCGRYTHLFTWKQLHRLLELLSWPEVELPARFNVAPMQMAPVVRLSKSGERAGAMLKWGLVPSWATDPSVGSRSINARAEKVFEKPAFRKAAMQRRCLVPISGFYEWRVNEGEKLKQPYWIGREDREPLCLAGLWERWIGAGTQTGEHGGEQSEPRAALETFTILTTSPNALMRRLHDRMPVIVPRERWDVWLNPASERAELDPVLGPYEGDDLVAYPVSRAVNSPRRDDPSLIERVEEPPPVNNLFI